MSELQAQTSGVPSVIDLLDELQRIRNMAPGEMGSDNSRDEYPRGNSPLPSPTGHNAVRRWPNHRQPSVPHSYKGQPDDIIPIQYRPVYRTSTHSHNNSNNTILNKHTYVDNHAQHKQMAQPRENCQPVATGYHFHEQSKQEDGGQRSKCVSSGSEGPRHLLSDWLHREGGICDEVSMPSDWLPLPSDHLLSQDASSRSIGTCSRTSSTTGCRCAQDAATNRCSDDVKDEPGADNNNHNNAVVTTPPQRRARPQTLCLDFPTPPSEFLSSGSPRHRRTASGIGSFSTDGRYGGAYTEGNGGLAAGHEVPNASIASSSIDQRRLEKGRNSQPGESAGPHNSMLSFRSELSRRESLISVNAAHGHGTPLVWSANSRRCSREWLEVPGHNDLEMHMRNIDLRPPLHRNHCSMADGVWRAHSAEVITRHSLHVDEIAHMTKNQNMVRRRSADLLEECLRRHTQSLSEMDTLQAVGLVTANQIVSKRRWRRMVLRERAVDTFAVACGGTCCMACLYACVAYFFLPGTWPTVFGFCKDALCALR
ncbi:uncharacterized protein LOC111265084 isoform X2 [Varroa jacobsoni]|uniref:uncharacterized protein LOC111265084 isoform X2 n=1 Tax=Varroa jacobsoni TaxID=62625 RepID=UPI000BF98854|nr:uncharacterized protein LOC111265084 isoform X2 [Varroa jacobsoni]XP_022697192.1 uncharacterized protein LOC111265084 isoform X2 [Varroa jacobsoni]XP_022697193.1 uncharacterized protein LOC111265084 isoform X2 [Varroa jacobsoni]XP_022697195.1 uncharacterized protein LOC111265084 isoform X2 [Varroa jacobsoni]